VPGATSKPSVLARLVACRSKDPSTTWARVSTAARACRWDITARMAPTSSDGQHEQAVAAAPHGSAKRAGYLANLCQSQLTLFGHTGQLADVDAAVDAGRRAVRDGAGHPERFVMPIALGAALRVRAERIGSTDDPRRGRRTSRAGTGRHP
jgi:hypothetical protein